MVGAAPDIQLINPSSKAKVNLLIFHTKNFDSSKLLQKGNEKSHHGVCVCVCVCFCVYACVRACVCVTAAF